MLRICEAYLDRLRERPLEAGATTSQVPLEPPGTVPTPAEPGPCSNPVDGRSIARFHTAAAMGYERWRYRGYVNLYRERAERGRKISDSNQPDLEAAPALYPALRRCIAGCEGGVPAGWSRGCSRDCRARRHFRSPHRPGLA